MNPLPLEIRDPVRFRLESIRTHLLKRLVRTYERGLNGEIDKDQAPGYHVGVKAAQMLLDRIDPVPREPSVNVNTGPLIVMWQQPDPSSSPTPLDPSKPNSTNALPENTHASVSWSATDDSAKA
jgi:hypothetical protein